MIREDYNSEEERDDHGRWVGDGGGGSSSGNGGSSSSDSKSSLLAVLGLSVIGLSGAVKLIGTPYSTLNCSQFACKLTGHKKATAKQLFNEGKPGKVSEAKNGDIVAFNGSHVAVMTNQGLMDSTPERGVGFVANVDPRDSWYKGPVRIVSGSPLKEATSTTLLAGVIESLGQPGVLGAPGRKIERVTMLALKAYFKALGRSLEKVNLEGLVTGEKAHVVAGVEAKLYNPLRLNRPDLIKAVSLGYMKAIVAGWKHDHVERPGDTSPGPYSEADDFSLEPATDDDLDKLGLTGQRAADWSAEQSAKLVTKIDSVTRDRLASVIATGIEDQLGVPGTARLVRATVDDMSVSRSLMIAATEVNDAFTFAALTKMSAIGVEYKQLILSPDACEICQENDDEGPIPVDDNFASGDDGPPFHPLCRCAVTGARPPDEENDD